MRIKHHENSIGLYMFGAFFLLMLLFPAQYQFARGIFLAVIVFGSMALVISKSETWSINKTLLAISIMCLLVSIFSLSLGFLMGNPGTLQSITVYLFWPLLFIWAIGLPLQQSSILLFIKVLIAGSFVVGVVIILSVLESSVGENVAIVLNVFRVNSGIFQGAIKVSSPMTPVLLFFLPFSICLILIRKNIPLSLFSKRWWVLLIAALILTIVNLIITGRAVFWLVALFSLPVVLSFIYGCGLKINFVRIVTNLFLAFIIFTVIGFAVLNYYTDVNFGVYYSLFVEKVFHVSEPGSVGYRRYEQFVAMLNGIQNHPIFGQGLGAAEYKGSDTWQFELSYFGLIFHVGLLGFMVYALSFLWLISVLLKLSRRNINVAILAAPLLSGMLVFLLANATNPLLSKFDFLWVIFLPLALANYALRQNDLNKMSEQNVSQRISDSSKLENGSAV